MSKMTESDPKESKVYGMLLASQLLATSTTAAGVRIQRGREKAGLPRTFKLIARFWGFFFLLGWGFFLPSDCVLDAGRFSC